MSEIIAKLQKNTRVDCPSYLPSNIILEGIMGSYAYGCQDPAKSDFDYYGIAIPPKDYIYIHEAGYVPGFDTNVPKFEQYQSQLNYEGIQYDLNIYNIVKFFKLTIEGSPNCIDFLYIPINCITHISKVGTLIRDNRHLFLSKKLFHSYKGYSFSQLSKVKNKKYENSKRKEDVDKHGFSTKECYHLVRLMSEIKQILVEEAIDLQRDNEHYKAIRRGEVPLEEIEKWFYSQELELEKLYLSSKLPYAPKYDEVRELLLNCLEEFYGTQTTTPTIKSSTDKQFNLLLRDLLELHSKYNKYRD